MSATRNVTAQLHFAVISLVLEWTQGLFEVLPFELYSWLVGAGLALWVGLRSLRSDALAMSSPPTWSALTMLWVLFGKILFKIKKSNPFCKELLLLIAGAGLEPAASGLWGSQDRVLTTPRYLQHHLVFYCFLEFSMLFKKTQLRKLQIFSAKYEKRFEF